jgi:hypothetical protein
LTIKNNCVLGNEIKTTILLIGYNTKKNVGHNVNKKRVIKRIKTIIVQQTHCSRVPAALAGTGMQQNYRWSVGKSRVDIAV